MIISKENKFVFIHIPKTAGTSISLLLRELTKGEYKEPPHIHMPSRFGIDYLKNEGEDPNQYFFFAFVRNPYERLHSLFHFIQTRWPQRLKGKDFQKWLLTNEEIYERRQTFPGEISVPNTRKPQLDWLTTEKFEQDKPLSRLIPKFIGRYENLENDLKEIISQIGLVKDQQATSWVKYKLKKLQDYQRDKNYRKYYTGQGREFVEQYFKADLDYFDYDF